MSNPIEPNDQNLMRLSEYLDGTLDPREREELERMLAGDEALRGELATLREIDSLTRRWWEAAPELDWERFAWESRRRREAFEAERGRFRIVRLLRPLAAAAVIALCATAGYFYALRRATELDRHPVRKQAVASVTVERASLAPRESIIVNVEVSRALPADAVATVGPVPAGRTLVVAAGRSLDDAVEKTNSYDALF